MGDWGNSQTLFSMWFLRLDLEPNPLYVLAVGDPENNWAEELWYNTSNVSSGCQVTRVLGMASKNNNSHI